MIKVKSKDITEFLAKSASIESNGVLPVLDYIELRVEGNEGILIKTNQELWCRSVIAVESDKNCTVLMEISKLKAFVSAAGEEFTINKTGNKIEYSGKMKGAHGILSGSNDVFPKFPDMEKLQFKKLPEGFSKCINTASSLVTEAPELPSSFVSVTMEKKGHPKETYFVDASDRNAAYRYRYEDSISGMMLSESACRILNGFEEIQHASSERFDFFDVGNTTFAFLKTECKPMAFDMIYEGIKKNAYVVADKTEMLEILDYITKTASAEKKEGILFIEVRIVINGGKMILSYADDLRSENAEKVMDVENVGNVEENCVFNGKLLKSVLKTVPFKKVGIILSSRVLAWVLFSPDDEDYTGLIMKLVDK